MLPEISVVIPAYNRESLIGETIRSLLCQSQAAREIIVVDDGSTDGTARVAGQFGSPVRVIRCEHAGPSAARNTGFWESRGEYIHFFDSDDVAVPNKHAVQARVLSESGADIAYGPWVKVGLSGQSCVPVNAVYQQTGLPRGSLVKALLTDWSIVPQACLFRRELVEKVGGFPEDLSTLEDQLFFLRCLLSGAQVRHSPGTLVLYRENNADKISEAPGRKKERCREWALFQTKAGMACEHYGLEPWRWFGFRARAWAVARCVDTLNLQLEADLKRYLDCLPSGGAWQYAVHDFAARRWSSVQQRLFNRRGGRSFCMGDLTPEQYRLIRSAGYSHS
ncbi:MAG: hypothetical protein RL648_1450 [Verrucomicrobiota bacterium]